MGDLCSTGDGAQDFFHQFVRRTTKERIPLSGTMDLTYRCNLRCIHCYLDPNSSKRGIVQQEMDTGQVVNILDEITSAGCLYLLMTGGEPLMRRDFPEIYRHAKEIGLLVTVFTNGTLISPKTLDLFKDMPPKAIEISLYGATAETYEGITGVRGSYERCIEGIHQLLNHGQKVRLKTVLMTANQHEFYEMENIARDFGVPFRFDAAIFPRFNGDHFPVELRVTPEDAIEKEFSEPKRKREWKEYYDHFHAIPSSNYVYECGAGLTYFHIDAYGNLQPCLMSVNHKTSILGERFLSVWRDEVPIIREIKMKADHSCYDCPKRILCGYCPPFFEMENGSETSNSEFLCSMGQLRYERLQSLSDRRKI